MQGSSRYPILALSHKTGFERERPMSDCAAQTFGGHLDRALDHLRITTDGGFFNASYLGSDPWVDPMRSEPRFQEMLRAAQARQDAIDRQLQARE